MSSVGYSLLYGALALIPVTIIIENVWKKKHWQNQMATKYFFFCKIVLIFCVRENSNRTNELTDCHESKKGHESYKLHVFFSSKFGRLNVNYCSASRTMLLLIWLKPYLYSHFWRSFLSWKRLKCWAFLSDWISSLELIMWMCWTFVINNLWCHAQACMNLLNRILFFREEIYAMKNIDSISRVNCASVLGSKLKND